MQTTPSPAASFRALHAHGCFLLLNPWDIGSAVFLASLGVPALATTSAGYAFSRARPDTVTALSLDDVLAHVRDLVSATTLPISVDFQHGYASSTEAVRENVSRCLATGAAGCSIEDASGDPTAPLFERAEAIDRVRAACAARDVTEPQAVVTARCEAWLVGAVEPATIAIDRLVAYAEAGADCLFAPGVTDAGTISEIVAAVAPKPVNVLMSSPSPTLDRAHLEALGVRRISVGSALARVAWGAFVRSARSIVERGEFESFADAASFDELDSLFGRSPAKSVS